MRWPFHWTAGHFWVAGSCRELCMEVCRKLIIYRMETETNPPSLEVHDCQYEANGVLLRLDETGKKRCTRPREQAVSIGVSQPHRRSRTYCSRASTTSAVTLVRPSTAITLS